MARSHSPVAAPRIWSVSPPTRPSSRSGPQDNFASSSTVPDFAGGWEGGEVRIPPTEPRGTNRGDHQGRKGTNLGDSPQFSKPKNRDSPRGYLQPTRSKIIWAAGWFSP